MPNMSTEPKTLEDLASEFIDNNENGPVWQSPGGARRLLTELLAAVDANADKRGRGIAKIQAEREIEALQARVERLEIALGNVPNLGHNDDCLFCGLKDREAQQALVRP